jgi:PAS domain S-box-containing protein
MTLESISKRVKDDRNSAAITVQETASCLLRAVSDPAILLDEQGFLVSVNSGWNQIAASTAAIRPINGGEFYPLAAVSLDNGLGRLPSSRNFLSLCDAAPRHSSLHGIAKQVRSCLTVESAQDSATAEVHLPCDFVGISYHCRVSRVPIGGALYALVVFGQTTPPAGDPPAPPYRRAFEHSATGMAITTSDGVCTEANDAFCTLVSTTPLDLIGKPLSDFVDALDLPTYRTRICGALSGNADRQPTDIRLLEPSGKRVATVLYVTAVRDRRGATESLILQFENISDRKNAEDEWQYIAASARCILWNGYVIETADREVHWQIATIGEKHEFYPTGKVAVSPMNAWFLSRLPEDQERVNRFGSDRVRAGSPGYAQEFRCRTRTGEIRSFHETVELHPVDVPDGTSVAGYMPDVGGSPIRRCWRAIGVAVDITEQKQSDEKLRHVTAAARCILWSATIQRKVDEAGTPYYAWELELPQQEAASEFLPLEVADGETFWDALARSSPPDEIASKHANSNRALDLNAPGYSQEFSCVCCDGSVRFISEDVRLQHIEPGLWQAVGVCTDVTERRRLQELMLRNDKLTSLGELVAGIAHEINNPIAAISGHAQLLALHADPSVREDAAAVKQMAARVSRITRSLLGFARDSSAQGIRRSISVREIIESSVALVGSTLRAQDVVLTLHGDGKLIVEVAETQIEQVVVNILNNAVQAMKNWPVERRTIDIRITSEPDETGRLNHAVVIEDTGPGVSASVASKIFDPFFTTKDIGEGTGLGLSISHGIMAAHNGRISHQETPGGGATFKLTLPAA